MVHTLPIAIACRGPPNLIAITYPTTDNDLEHLADRDRLADRGLFLDRLIASVTFFVLITPFAGLVSFVLHTLTQSSRSHLVRSNIQFGVTVQWTRSEQLWDRPCRPLTGYETTGTRSVHLLRSFIVVLPHRRSRCNCSNCGDRCVYNEIAHEEQDLAGLRSAPENKPLMPSLGNLRK